MTDLLSWVGPVTGIILAIGAIWLGLETRQYRMITQRTLDELRDQSSRSFQAYVVPRHWNGKYLVELANLGPGAALKVELRANYLDWEGPPTVKGLWLNCPGIPAGRTVRVTCAPVELHSDLPEPDQEGEENMWIQLTVYTVRQEKMEPYVKHLIRWDAESEGEPGFLTYNPD